MTQIVKPLVAHTMYLAGYIENVGTGIEDMITRLKAHGLPEPEFVQKQEFKVIIARPPMEVTTHITMQDTMQDTMHVAEREDSARKQTQSYLSIQL